MTTETVTPVSVSTTYAAAPAPDATAATTATAPAAAPAAPAAPAPAAPAPAAPNIPEAKADGKLEPTGDPALDLALDFINGVGISGTDPAIEAARDGDFAMLEAKLAAMGDKAKGYDKFIALAKQAFERHTQSVEKQNAEVKSIVLQECGGEAGWAAIQAFASANATPQEKAQINASFAAGGVQARAAAQYLRNAYEKAGRPGYREPKAAIRPDAGANANETAKPLTAKDYSKAVQDLYAKARGRDISQMPEYAALQAQRLAAKRAGY